MAAVLLALAASASWGVSDFTGGVVGRRRTLLGTLVVTQLTGLVLLAVVAAASGDGLPPAGDTAFAVLAGVSGIVGIAGLYRGLAIGAMSVVAPLSATAAVVPAAFGIARGEQLGAIRYAGIVVALGGILLAAREPGARGRLAAGAAPALLAIGGFGGVFLSLARASEHSFSWACLFARATSSAIVVAIVLARRPPLRGRAADFARLGLAGILDGAGNVFFAVATTRGLVSVVSVLVSLYPLVVVGLAHAVLGERITRAQKLGAAAALAGAALVSTG